MSHTIDLLSAEDLWQRTFDAVPDMIFLLDNSHRILHANRAAAHRLGCSPSELVGLYCHEVIHGTPAPPESCPYHLLLQDGQERSASLRAERLNGDFAVSVTPLLGADHQTLGAVHVARDVGEFKRVEAELRLAKGELKQRHALTLAAVLDGLWQWDIASGHVEYSQRWETLLGYSREEIPATLEFFKGILHPDDADAVWAAIEGHLQQRMKDLCPQGADRCRRSFVSPIIADS